MFTRLSGKLTGLLIAVIVVGSTLTLVAITHVSRHQFFVYVQQSDQARARDLANLLAGYYDQQGSFAGVDQLLSLPRVSDETPVMDRMHDRMHGASGRMMFQTATGDRLVLIDSGGEIIAATASSPDSLQDVHRVQEYAVPVVSNGEQIAWLLVGSMIDGSLNPQQEHFLGSLRVAVLFSALAVAILALMLGAVFLSGITRPLSALSVAARNIAAGDLTVTIPAAGRDEVGILADSFGVMRAALAESQQQRELLFRNIAHELRTPLTLLRGEVEAMLDGVYPMSPKSLRSLNEEITILDRLVSDVRSIATMESAGFALQQRPVDVAVLLTRLQSVFQKDACERGMEIDVDIEPVLPAVSADQARLTQVFSNLITNAIHHSRTADRIVLQAAVYHGDIEGEESGPKGLAITVRDNGQGIPAEHVPYVFDRLYRVHAARSRATGGSGLGLAIARQIVEAHGGSIAATAAPGGGLEVIVRLPLDQ